MEAEGGESRDRKDIIEFLMVFLLQPYKLKNQWGNYVEEVDNPY